MRTAIYKLPEEITITPLLASLARLEDKLARLDERIGALPYAGGLAERLLYGEACACLDHDDLLIHREDLVLLDGNAFDGRMSPELSQALVIVNLYRKALKADADRLLASTRPGEDTSSPSVGGEHIWVEGASDPVRTWRTVLKRTQSLPPVLSAAIACDAWLTLHPDDGQAWRAPLLAALVLKARRKTGSLLLPVASGRRATNNHCDGGTDFVARISAMFDWFQAAADLVQGEMQRVSLAEQLMRRHLEGRRRSSRLPLLVDLLLMRPIISVPMAAKALRCSPQAVERMMRMLGSTPRLLTERKRYRFWGV